MLRYYSTTILTTITFAIITTIISQKEPAAELVPNFAKKASPTRNSAWAATLNCFCAQNPKQTRPNLGISSNLDAETSSCRLPILKDLPKEPLHVDAIKLIQKLKLLKLQATKTPTSECTPPGISSSCFCASHPRNPR